MELPAIPDAIEIRFLTLTEVDALANARPGSFCAIDRAMFLAAAMTGARKGELAAGALEDAVRGLAPEELSGPGGLLSQLAGRVIQAALEAEMTDHVGHPPGGVPPGPNVRNRSTPKTVQTDLGPVEIKTPRNRASSLEPQLVKKRYTRGTWRWASPVTANAKCSGSGGRRPKGPSSGSPSSTTCAAAASRTC